MYENSESTNVNGIIRDAEGVLCLSHHANGWGAAVILEPWLAGIDQDMEETVRWSKEEVRWRGEAAERLRYVHMSTEEVQVFMLILAYSPRQAWRYACHCARLHPWEDLLAVCDQVQFARDNRITALTCGDRGNLGLEAAAPDHDDYGEERVVPPVYRGDYRPAPTDPFEAPSGGRRLRLGVLPSEEEMIEMMLKMAAR